MEILESPRLRERVDAALSPKSNTSLATAHFLRQLEPLNRWGDVSVPEELRDDTLELRRLDSKVFGREVLDLLYDPASTPFAANFLWGAFRGLGRAMVLRHFDAHEIEPSSEYRDSLFAGSQNDVEQLDKAMEIIYSQAPGAMIRRELHSFAVRRNRVAIDEAMEQLEENSNAWMARLGSGPE
jgi:hypothetical protein